MLNLFLCFPHTKAMLCLGCYNAVRTYTMITALCAYVSQQTMTHDSEKGESHTASVHKHTIAKQIFLQTQQFYSLSKRYPKVELLALSADSNETFQW